MIPTFLVHVRNEIVAGLVAYCFISRRVFYTTDVHTRKGFYVSLGIVGLTTMGEVCASLKACDIPYRRNRTTSITVG